MKRRSDFFHSLYLVDVIIKFIYKWIHLAMCTVHHTNNSTNAKCVSREIRMKNSFHRSQNVKRKFTLPLSHWKQVNVASKRDTSRKNTILVFGGISHSLSHMKCIVPLPYMYWIGMVNIQQDRKYAEKETKPGDFFWC